MDVVVTLKNSGPGTLGVTGWLTDPDPSVTIVSGAAAFGDMSINGTADNAAEPFTLSFASDLLDGSMVPVGLHINDAGSFDKVVPLYFRVGGPLLEAQFTHTTDSCQFTISNYGVYGLAPGSVFNRGGVGFKYPAEGSNNLYQCALLVGVAPDSVSDGMRNLIFSIDRDFVVAPGGNLVTFNGRSLGDVETFSRFNDSAARNPIGITIEQRTASFTSALDANYVIIQYVLQNDRESPIENLYVGIYFDWDFPWGGAGFDKASYYAPLNLGYMWQHNALQYRGTAVLNHEGASTFFDIVNDVYIFDGVSEEEKYRFLTNGFADTSFATFKDQSYSIATGPFTLAPGEVDTAAFAVIGAATQEHLFQSAERALAKYQAAVPVVEISYDPVLPAQFELSQNYPNPFNPFTQIEFALDKSARVRLTILNTLGQQVTTLLDDNRTAGRYAVQWLAADERGRPLASGVYFYRLEVDGAAHVRKMLLLK